MQVVLRPAQPGDFDFCVALYFAEGGWIIDQLKLDRATVAAKLRKRWAVDEVRLIAVDGATVGWLQSSLRDGALFVAQFYLAGAWQRRGVGAATMDLLLNEAGEANRAITLGVARINPAVRFYKRQGFYINREDEQKYYMRREPGVSAPIANLRP